MEFKVQDTDYEESLEDTAEDALEQIKEKRYAERLHVRGIPEDRILYYGFTFQGKKVQIGKE